MCENIKVLLHLFFLVFFLLMGGLLYQRLTLTHSWSLRHQQTCITKRESWSSRVSWKHPDTICVQDSPNKCQVTKHLLCSLSVCSCMYKTCFTFRWQRTRTRVSKWEKLSFAEKGGPVVFLLFTIDLCGSSSPKLPFPANDPERETFPLLPISFIKTCQKSLQQKFWHLSHPPTYLTSVIKSW